MAESAAQLSRQQQRRILEFSGESRLEMEIGVWRVRVSAGGLGKSIFVGE
jgi:hypothetical protein